MRSHTYLYRTYVIRLHRERLGQPWTFTVNHTFRILFTDGTSTLAVIEPAAVEGSGPIRWLAWTAARLAADRLTA